MGVNVTVVTMHPPVLYDEGEIISNWFQQLVAEKTGGPITKELTPLQIRAKICEIEQQMEEAVDNNILHNTAEEYPIKHTFTDGAYIREISIPAGHLVVGKIHKHEHLNFISKGRVTVITEEGGVEELIAPVTLISPVGVKRLLFTHEDTVWTVVHVTQEKDLDKVEEAVIAKTYTDMGWEQPQRLTLFSPEQLVEKKD